jgi:hypothetical protein
MKHSGHLHYSIFSNSLNLLNLSKACVLDITSSGFNKSHRRMGEGALQ